MLHELQTLPAGLVAARALIGQLDHLLLVGFAGGRHQAALASVERAFAASALAGLVAASAAGLGRGELQPDYFLALAAARTAVQGAQYDLLHQQVRQTLGRAVELPAVAEFVPPVVLPLLVGARSWLTELAVTGFARLDASAVQAFLPAIEQLRAQPALARLAYLLTGFADELLEAVPVARPDDVPFWRWCDLWSAALLETVGSAPAPAPQLVSGSFVPLGLEQRERAEFVSVVVYGLLERDGQHEYLRCTCSRFKVGAIRNDQSWLLLPEFAPVLEALDQGKRITLAAMPQFANGDLRWDAACATLGAACKPLDLAASVLAGAAIRPLPARDRHPVQLGEPLLLSGYRLSDDGFQLEGDLCLALDRRWNEAHGPSRAALTSGKALFGLLRFDAERWAIQPLTVASSKGKLTFAGQAGVKLLKKPPKANPVAILEERAKRLLRKS